MKIDIRSYSTPEFVAICGLAFLVGAASNYILFGVYMYYGIVLVAYGVLLLIHFSKKTLRPFLLKQSFILGTVVGWIAMYQHMVNLGVRQ